MFIKSWLSLYASHRGSVDGTSGHESSEHPEVFSSIQEVSKDKRNSKLVVRGRDRMDRVGLCRKSRITVLFFEN